MTVDAHEPDADWDVLLQGYIDGELDAANVLRCERHLASCRDCAAALDQLRETRRKLSAGDVRWPVPEALHTRIAAALDAEVAGHRRSFAPAVRRQAIVGWLSRWGLVPSLAALAASIALFVAVPAQRPSIQQDLVAGHVRSLLADHLTDVATSDQHTVKPWFNGKIDFSPPVADLATRGFPLIGGRVDYLEGRVVAVLVYRRNGHVINLFVWPSQDASRSVSEHDGYNLIGWGEAGLRFWLVSDLNAVELEEFRQDFSDAMPR